MKGGCTTSSIELAFKAIPLISTGSSPPPVH
jgi:hypothetical protein